jgi:hypothetical protein
MGQRRLSDAWQILDEKVPACQETGQGQTELPVLAEDYPASRVQESFH